MYDILVLEPTATYYLHAYDRIHIYSLLILNANYTYGHGIKLNIMCHANGYTCKSDNEHIHMLYSQYDICHMRQTRHTILTRGMSGTGAVLYHRITPSYDIRKHASVPWYWYCTCRSIHPSARISQTTFYYHHLHGSFR